MFRHKRGELDAARIGGTALAYQAVAPPVSFPVLSRLDPAPSYEFKLYTRSVGKEGAGATRWSNPMRMPLDRKDAELEARFAP